MNHRTKQVETLFEVLEDIDPKLKALGIIQVDNTMVYTSDDEEAANV